MSAIITTTKLRSRSTPAPSAIARPPIARRYGACSWCQLRQTCRSATAVKANASSPRQREGAVPAVSRAGASVSPPVNPTRIPRSAAAVKVNASSPRQRGSALVAIAAKPVIATTSTAVSKSDPIPVAVLELLLQQQSKYVSLLKGMSVTLLSAIHVNAAKTAALEERLDSIQKQETDIKTLASRHDSLELARAHQLKDVMPRLCEDIQHLKDQQVASAAQIGAALATKTAKNAAAIHSLHGNIACTEHQHALQQKKLAHVLRSVVMDLSTHATSIAELQLSTRSRAHPQQRFHAVQALMETGLFGLSKLPTPPTSDTEATSSEDESSSPTSQNCARGF